MNWYSIVCAMPRKNWSLQHAFQIRNGCDYDDFFIVSKQDAEDQYQKAAEMLDAILKYLE